MVVLLWLCLTLGGVTVFIFPKLKDILAGTGAPMPTVTRWVFESAPAVIGVMVPALFLIAIVWVYVLFRPRNPDRPKLLSVLGDHVKWHLPAWGWFERNYAMLQTVTCLRMGLRSGEPVDRAIGQAARLDINECYRRRLRRWLRRVQAGEGLAASAAASGAGAGLAWAFDQEANPGQTPAVLEMLESAYRSAYSYKAHIARSVFWPVVIVAMATLVGLVAVGVFQMFAAMVSHIEALT
jgi:type II secretory pathway component PulF